MNRQIIRTIFAVALMLPVVSYTPPGPISITIKGSDTMLVLVQKWAEAFLQKHPDKAIQVTGGGSGFGIDALITGQADICNASRQITRSEIEMIKLRFSTVGVEIPCARDGIAVYLNEQNPVSELTLQQVGDIFSGRITNWRDVGGLSAPINLYGRENNSGTYDVFKEVVVRTDYSRNCQELPGNIAIVNAVIRDPNGIGYGGAAFATTGVKDCKLKVSDTATAYAPTPETMQQGLYPVSRYLYMYTRSRPKGDLKMFINWVLSKEGQQIVTQLGYFPLH